MHKDNYKNERISSKSILVPAPYPWQSIEGKELNLTILLLETEHNCRKIDAQPLDHPWSSAP